MSRSYDVSINVAHVENDLDKVNAVGQVLESFGEAFDSDSYTTGNGEEREVTVTVSGHYQLCGGRTPDEQSAEWNEELEKLGPYHVEMHWWFAEREPDETCVFENGEDDA